jgi:hypothetical protein
MQSVCSRTHHIWSHRLVELSILVVVECLLYLFCSPSASPPDPKRQKVVGAKFAGDDVPSGGSVETAGTDPSTTSAGVVTVAVASTSLGHPAPSAGVTPPPATGTMVIKPRALRLKKSGMKKSSL